MAHDDAPRAEGAFSTRQSGGGIGTARLGRGTFGSQGGQQASREAQKTARQSVEKRGPAPINFVQRNILKVSKSQQRL